MTMRFAKTRSRWRKRAWPPAPRRRKLRQVRSWGRVSRPRKPWRRKPWPSTSRHRRRTEGRSLLSLFPTDSLAFLVFAAASAYLLEDGCFAAMRALGVRVARYEEKFHGLVQHMALADPDRRGDAGVRQGPHFRCDG